MHVMSQHNVQYMNSQYFLMSNRNETNNDWVHWFIPGFVLLIEILSIWPRRAYSGTKRNNLFSIREIREQYQNVLFSFAKRYRKVCPSFLTLLVLWIVCTVHCAALFENTIYYELSIRGQILGRNWDRSFKSFYPPRYSQSPLLTDFTYVSIVYRNLKSGNYQYYAQNRNEIVCSWIRLQETLSIYSNAPWCHILWYSALNINNNERLTYHPLRESVSWTGQTF